MLSFVHIPLQNLQPKFYSNFTILIKIGGSGSNRGNHTGDCLSVVGVGEISGAQKLLIRGLVPAQIGSILIGIGDSDSDLRPKSLAYVSTRASAAVL